MKRYLIRIGIVVLLIVTALMASGFNVNIPITANGFISISNIDVQLSSTAKAAGIYDETWGYELILDNGDIVQIGDNTTDDFKANVKTIRGINQDTWFSLGWLGGTFIPSVDGTTVYFDFNDNTHISIYPVEPSDRLPEGGIEYDITLDKKPAKPSVTLDIDWNNITWTKLYALDVEYTEQDCIDKWGETHTDFSINATTITGENIETSEVEVLKSRELYEINSYLGTAIESTDKATDYGEITDPESSNYGEHLLYHRISRTYLYIHRGQMTDALGQTAWVEDIILDEQAKTITFELPTVWLRNAEYPVSQVCGVDPAYTEEMAGSQTGSDGSWVSISLDNVFGTSLGTTNVVAEIMLENQQKGAENLIGVRTFNSSLNRYVNLHEAEPDGGGAGDTHCRMFVQTATYLSDPYMEVYTEDASDTMFYLLGYWENVSFTERIDQTSEAGAWVTWTLPDSGAADKVCQFGLAVNQESYTAIGVRNTSSSLSRNLDLHEAESGGMNFVDMLAKADASYEVEIYRSGTYGDIYCFGYFGSELDFVELWQSISVTSTGWQAYDMTSYLDQDGRVCDFMLTHADDDSVHVMGARDGDDSSTNRYLTEHEAESATHADPGAEYTGFSMSAHSNATGNVYLYYDTTTEEGFYLTGYFLPAGGFNIANSPSSENLGVVEDNSTYYAYGSAPSNPVQDGECTFTVTNSGDTCDLDMKITDFTGGTSWNIVSSSPSSDEVRITAYYSGQNPASGLVLANTDAEFYDALATSSSIKWDFKIETGTLTDEPNQHTATITVTAVAED